MSKTIIVTGASTGIGRATAIRLAKGGYNIGVNYIGDESLALEVKELCEKEGVKAGIYNFDVSNFEACKENVAKIFEDFGGEYGKSVFGLVNNAGITRDTLLLRMSEGDFDSVINVNLKSVFNMCSAVVPYLVKGKCGRIVNMSSVVGIHGQGGQTNYAASKAGIIGFTKSLAKEIGKRSITVNAIAPGFVRTQMTDVLADKVKEEILKQTALNSFGEPEDIANAINFLMSDDARYITSQVISVDGGMN